MLIFTLIMLALGGLAGAGIGAFAAKKSKDRRRSRAMAIIAGHETKKTEPGETPENAREKAAVKANNITEKLKKVAREQKAMHNTRSIPSLLMQSGMSISPRRFWIYAFLFATLASSLLSMTSLPDMVVGLLSFSLYFGFPRWFLRFRAARRQKLFLTDFADALEAMIRLLKAGMPVGEAISMVAREFSGPVGEEMGRIYNAQKLGVPMQDAVRQMAPRMPIPEVQMFATSIAIQVQTGSSLSEVLGNLSGVIRARYRLKRKVQALSAEAKISAMIIGALPVLVSLALWGVNPDYIALLFTHPTGKMLLAGAIIWMSLGILVMRQMINFRV